MLFTVFQYLPILEDEVHASKTLNKKADDSSPEEDGSDSDDSGDDDESGKDDFCTHHNNQHFKLYSSVSDFNFFNEDYNSLISSITTPPPKI